MTIERVVPILRVTDLHRALAFYCGTLGFVVDFRYAASPSGPDYLGLSLDGHQLHLSTFGGDGVPGVAIYFYVADVDALFSRFVAGGWQPPVTPDSPVEQEPVEQTWGMRELYIRDPFGNTLRFGSALPPRATRD